MTADPRQNASPNTIEAATHILLAEDCEDVRHLYSHFLIRKGYRVTLACDGQEALDKAFQIRPDLILMDLGLPVISGGEAIRRLKADKRTKRIPIIVVTAFASVPPASLGCESFLVKPCRPVDLLVEILRVIGPAQKRGSPPAQGTKGARAKRAGKT